MRHKFIAEFAEAIEINRFDFRWKVRPETSDETVLSEVFNKKEYRHARFEPDDIWIDAGANIGAFTIFAAASVAHVWSVEPSEGNFYLLNENIKMNGIDNTTTIMTAIVGDDREMVDLYINVGVGKSSHRTQPVQGRPHVKIAAVNIERILKQSGANKLKLDVEGEEHAIIAGITDNTLDRLDEIILEFHPYAYKKNGGMEYDYILARLRDHFSLCKHPKRSTGGWGKIMWFGR